MATRVPLYEVLQKIQSGRLSDREMRSYFNIAPNPNKPFDFIVTFNADNVDLGNVSSADALAAPMLRDAGILLDLRKRAAPRPRAFDRKLPLIAEGDSWFKLPNLGPIVPRTLIDFLAERYATINLAHWGDTLSEIVLKGEFWPFLLSGESDVFLFSAGGNDLLGGGQLSRLLELFDVDHSKPSDAGYYLKPEFFDNLNLVVDNYEALIMQIKARTPHVIMLGHGYDYAIPQINGPWIGGPMMRQGLDPQHRPQLCAAIVVEMVDAFNIRLKALENKYPANFKYVDLRGKVRRGEWWDEFHPREVATRRTSEVFARVLADLPASSAVVASPFAAASRLAATSRRRRAA